jgi:hypothetical protein
MRSTWLVTSPWSRRCSGDDGGSGRQAPAARPRSTPRSRPSCPLGSDRGSPSTPRSSPAADQPASDADGDQGQPKQGGVWTELGDADWTCLGTPTADQPATTAIALTGRVTDYQTGNGVGAAPVTAFPMLTPATSLGAATTSNLAATRGEFTMTAAPLPAGVRRYGFRIEGTGYLRSYALNRYLAPGAAQSIVLDALAESTANAIPAFVGVTRDPARGLTLGSLVDCQGRPVSNAVAAISTTAGTATLPAGANTFYFSAGSTSLPVRHTQAATMNKDGLFIVLDVVPVAPAYVQVWGFRTAAELASGTLTLLAEAPVLAEANAASIIDLAPRRAP